MYRAPPSNGQLDKLLGNIPSPNGLVLNAAQNAVFVNVTRGNCVWRVPMLPDGSPYKVGLLIQMSGGADNRTLYITESESGSILCADMPVPGQPMYSHA